mmetsp:Transcript_100411/g.284474  ORF Transcript_100411/g.284474 Transcript_100411/m.284474 type:complete len:257 (+) Transcript_100411:978-1748(+)
MTWCLLRQLSTCGSVVGISSPATGQSPFTTARDVVATTPTPSNIVCPRMASRYSATRRWCQRSSSSPNRTHVECLSPALPSPPQCCRSSALAACSAACMCWSCERALECWTASLATRGAPGLSSWSTAIAPESDRVAMNSRSASCIMAVSSGVGVNQLTATTKSVLPSMSAWSLIVRSTCRRRRRRPELVMCAAMSAMTVTRPGGGGRTALRTSPFFRLLASTREAGTVRFFSMRPAPSALAAIQPSSGPAPRTSL